MKPSIKHSGFGRVEGMLRNIAQRVPEAARGQMHRSSNRVVDLAKKMTPEDEGLLRDSIRIEKSYGTNGRLQIDVIAGGQTVTRANGRSVNLDQYALLVHEAYETAVAPNGPGKKTRQKMSANPSVRVGSGFLFRALQTEAKAFERVMIQVINRVIREEGG